MPKLTLDDGREFEFSKEYEFSNSENFPKDCSPRGQLTGYEHTDNYQFKAVLFGYKYIRPIKPVETRWMNNKEMFELAHKGYLFKHIKHNWVMGNWTTDMKIENYLICPLADYRTPNEKWKEPKVDV